VGRVQIIGLAIVGILLFTGFELIRFQRKRIKELSTDLEQVQTLADNSKHTAETYINLFGREVSKAKVLDLSLRNARELRQREELKHIEQFSGVKKNLGNLQQVITVQASVIQSLKIKNTDTLIITKTDTIKASKFRYSDKFTLIKGHTTADTTYLDSLGSIVPLEGAVYLGKRTKKFLFFRVGPRETISEITSPNPFVKITDQQFINIKQ